MANSNLSCPSHSCCAPLKRVRLWLSDNPLKVLGAPVRCLQSCPFQAAPVLVLHPLLTMWVFQPWPPHWLSLSSLWFIGSFLHWGAQNYALYRWMHLTFCKMSQNFASYKVILDIKERSILSHPLVDRSLEYNLCVMVQTQMATKYHAASLLPLPLWRA